MVDVHSNKYYPTLIIGAGGTGIKVLRFIQSFADTKLDPHLRVMLQKGAMQLVGIDTDSKSNDRELTVDPNLLKIEGISNHESEAQPLRLSRLPKNWLSLDSAALNNALPRVHQFLATGNDPSQEESLSVPLKSIHPLINCKFASAKRHPQPKFQSQPLDLWYIF